jgi:hypothetical protein
MRTVPYILKRKRPLAEYIFNWNTSVTGHKQSTVGFPQRKTLLRSTENSVTVM